MGIRHHVHEALAQVMPDLTFRIQKQEQLNWCWAAISASIAVYYKDPQWQQQCTVVDAVLKSVIGGANCCSAGASVPCNIPWDLRQALLRTGHLEKPINGAISFEVVTAEVESRRPLACRIFGPGPIAHFVAIIGCARSSVGQQWVTIADPSPAAGNTTTLLYPDLLTNYHYDSRWDRTYLTR